MLEWDLPEPFTLAVQVLPEHIDGLRHTNNAVYVSWCEQVAWAHSTALGLDLDSYQRLNRAMVITHSEFDYLQASRLGDKLQVATWIDAWDGRLTMQRRFQLVRPADASTLLRARMSFACVALDSGRPRRLPPEFIDGYGKAVLDDQVSANCGTRRS
ncbi:MAG: thioesterase family protein [Halieaceae bacterium]